MSGTTPRSASSGMMSAQLPTSPTETFSFLRIAFFRMRSASSSVVTMKSQYPVLEPLLDALRINVNAEKCSAGHGGGERLSSSHSAHSAGDDELAGKISAKMFLAGGRECLECALHDALRADVDPASGGHLAVHHQPGALKFVELLPVRPVADEIGVGDQNAR